MRKLNVIFIILFALLMAGCAEEERVDSFEAMGCSSSFGDIYLSKPSSQVMIYPIEAVLEINCNSDTSVTIDFYDNNYPGHYKYFLVNGYSTTYSETIYRGYTGISSGSYRFTTDTSLLQDGAYYGIYEVRATNLENGKYTIKQYRIEAYDVTTYGKMEPAVSNFKARPAPSVINLDNNTLSDNLTVDNITKELNSKDNSTK